jgi:hypothetical protein
MANIIGHLRCAHNRFGVTRNTAHIPVRPDGKTVIRLKADHRSFIMRISVKTGAVLFSLAAGSAANAAVLDLTTAGASGIINGAIYEQIDPRSTGTGILNPFLRIQANSTEQGYNTDARPVEFDQKTDPFTRSLLVSSLTTVMRDGITYTQFILDVNEPGAQRLISLDSLKIYVGSTPDVSSLSSLTNLAYDLDGAGDYSILLDASLNSGSGSGDMLAWIPYDLLQDPDNSYLYLYSKFTCTQGGFEEWSTFGVGASIGEAPPSDPPQVPLPPAIWAGAAACGLVARFARRMRRTQA